MLLHATTMLCFLAAGQAAPAGAPDPTRSVLAESGLEPTTESLAAWLGSLHPDRDERRRLAGLIAQLGDDDFYEREAAMRELLRRPVHSPELLARAIEGDNAEIRWRAGQVKKIGARRLSRLLSAVFRTIREHEIEGLAEPVLESLAFCGDEHLRSAARRALTATAGSDDIGLLTQALSRDDPQIVAAAATALEHVAGDKADEALLPLLGHDDDHVRLAAARALANHGGRPALLTLVELLDSDEPQVRTQTAQTLRMLTGQRFAFVGYENAGQRAEAVAQWRAWVESHGESAELHFPLKDTDVLLGRTLISYYNSNRVVEYDDSGEVVWTQSVPTPRGIAGLPNGHRVVAAYSTRIIHEFDADGNEVWRSNPLPGSPYSCQRLDNGNTLVACYSSREVVEVRPDKTIAWRKQFDSAPRDARRLDNGHTLVALYTASQVVEVDADGNVVWEADGMNRPYSAERLDSGHTLVAQYSGRRVVEIDRDGDIVWKLENLSYPYDARRLASGNTLIVDRTSVRELDRDGKVVWEQPGAGAARVDRY